MSTKGSRRTRSALKNTPVETAAQLLQLFDEQEKEQIALKEKERTSLELLYGKPGVPDAGKNANKIIDILGRVIDRPKEEPKLLPSPAPIAEEPRRVTLLRDHHLEYPDLFLEIFVQPDPSVRDDEARFAKMFARSRCQRAKSVLEADLVVFGGGSDVNPDLYGETRHPTTCYDDKRDENDIALYALCLEHGIPMLGICRGAQFLSVMNGGKLVQDIDNHYGNHAMFDLQHQQLIEKVSSVHHQAVRIHEGMQIIATSSRSKTRRLNATETDVGTTADIEAFVYRDTCCIGVQGHPEYEGYSYFTKWVLDLINDVVVVNPDIVWVDKNRRISPDLIAERDASIKATKKKGAK